MSHSFTESELDALARMVCERVRKTLSEGDDRRINGMGWCSATVIFDQIAETILSDQPIDKKAVLRTVVEALEDGDWDCQTDSEYWDHPIVQEIMRERHPRWFEEQPQ